MWRLKQHLTNSCVYINKKIEYCDSIRCQGRLRCVRIFFDKMYYANFSVYEMWSGGERVACGVITDDTKVMSVQLT